ncbi:UPF0223 family protein [Staphylococcus gallinarum]|jgi:uncharacterized protein YktA (UPF0223 family)|uniref:UPF0223 protein SGA02_06340 n=1 Tax=Staphylococcus gallinarum TaxID=1293 RepID=A0ABQ0Y088_STAGA|nr:UPF0223 family protein [Staphylococcus gallinarum]KIR12192.1 hypothetical protein SH09_07425 [Staphylococcus gallinarum]MBU7218487.1 UPF0223 family protein [Staphylococcus gallinarum]MCD8786786.1 UPF0223 family protein [Staphylococcus gallinarum]MCD8793272.1 UPF0223 family protein [Staphylococcus gallinarum]MCD8828539.1 UPF0223 family protein [Staphylococcus gallinarum]
MEYQYPIDLDWSNDEMMDVVSFFNAIEAYYETKVEGTQLIDKYKKFKNVVPGKAEEKQIFKEFEKNSGYNSYKAVKAVQSSPEQKYFSVNDK